jgi:hypothetical protein
MGWNCTIAVVRSAIVTDLAALGWSPTSRTVGWEDATSSAFGAIAAHERDGVLVLASGGTDLVEATEALGTLGDVYLGLFQSVTDTYVWETAGGIGRRSWQWSMFEELSNVGTPHPAEAGITQLDEDALFDLLDAGGLVYDEHLEEATMVVLDTDGGRAGAPRRKRFGLF